MTNAIAFMTANYVARETGYAMHGWAHGDGATQERFRPLVTFDERFDELLVDIRALGFEAVDIWGGHLGASWATDEHLELARAALERHSLPVMSYATWIEPSTIERACELARGLGTQIIGGGFSGDASALVPTLREHDVTLAIENHPERTPHELLARIEEGEGTFAATVDTGWWGTQGYDAMRALEELGDRVAHVHLKDVLHEGEPHETCRWGEGIVPIEGCVRTLQRLGYTGAYSIEHEPEEFDPSEDCRAMLHELRGWLA